jgi:hypothetical protein
MADVVSHRAREAREVVKSMARSLMTGTGKSGPLRAVSEAKTHVQIAWGIGISDKEAMAVNRDLALEIESCEAEEDLTPDHSKAPDVDFERL